MFSSVLILSALVAAAPVQTLDAQGRGGPRRVAAPRPGGVIVRAYYRPLYVSPFYSRFYDPFWYPYPYGWYAPYGYGSAYDDSASVRLQVTPRETEVFVDGAYAGTVDSFDGMFQRLHLEPGGHELTLYLEGHRTTTQRIFLEDRGTFRIRHEMVPLAAGEAPQPRPSSLSTPRSAQRSRAARGPQRPVSGTVRGDANFGAIAIRVQPADAEVLIDGERWEGPRNDEALVVQVAPGTHHVEVRKDGFRSYSSEVNVTATQTAPLNISLPRQ